MLPRLQLVFLPLHFTHVASFANYEFSYTPPLFGLQMEAHFLVDENVFTIDGFGDSLVKCAVLCGEDCHAFEVKNNICRLFKRFVVVQSTDKDQTVEVWQKRQLNLPFVGNIHTGPDLLVFRHDISDGHFWPQNVISQNKHDTSALQYSILDELENFRRNDGALHFKLCYPDLSNHSCYRWSQTDNPFGVVGEKSEVGFHYKESSLTRPWYFLGLSGNSNCSLLNGHKDVDLFWLAIGNYCPYMFRKVIPGPNYTVVTLVELYLELS